MTEGPSRQSIAVAVIVCEHYVVAGPRSEAGPLAGQMEFPGGRIQAGETPEDACRRELLEETGLQVGPLELLDEYDYDYPDRELTLSYYLSNAPYRGPLEKPWRWIRLTELTNVPSANDPILEAVRRRFVTAR